MENHCLLGKMIIIEGTDGSGKATQAEKLYSRLYSAGHSVRKVEFPNYPSQSSALIKMYLNGEFGNDPNDVNPYAASSFYAVDRYASYKQDWGGFYEQGGMIVADRYTTSNMVHQAVKIVDEQEKVKFLDWLWDLEFQKFQLPIPDMVIFLDMPPDCTRRLINERADKMQQGKQDIHERNQDYLVHCYNNYHAIADKYHWHKINCASDGQLRSIDEINEEVYQAVYKLTNQ